MLIEEKLRQYKDTLNQIVELEHASEKVSENLRRIEEHRYCLNQFYRHLTIALIFRRSSAASADLRAVQAKVELADAKLAEVQQIAASGGSMPNIETARQLFSEQLEFLDNEKSKLISELPPLAPTASSEDLSSSDVENGRTGSASPSFACDQLEEYAIDLNRPPVFNCLPSLSKFSRPKRPKNQRPPSAEFLQRYNAVKFQLF
jgi:hypothetical protein